MSELHQFFTPAWVCEAIVERHFAGLTMADHVLEPSCGPGRFLQALPSYVPATGVEIDPALVAKARAATGRPVIEGDFLKVELPGRFTHVIGNPPFDADTVHGFLRRIHGVLEEGGLCGLLLPAYIFQTSSKVMALHRDWSVSQELVPRNIFPGLKLPLVFAQFRKEVKRTLVGFLLYRETAEVTALPKDIKQALHGPAQGSAWRAAVHAAFMNLGASTTTLDALYGAVERPTPNQYWREKVRQVLQRYPEFKKVAGGGWSCGAAA